MTGNGIVSGLHGRGDTDDAPYSEPMTTDPAAVSAAKIELRRRLGAARRARPDRDRATARTAIAGHLLAHLETARTVCAYYSLPTEPLDPALLDTLAARGVTVLVPVVIGAEPLDWCRHGGPLRPGALGIAEPTGPRLGAAAIRSADTVLVPALAVDSAGNRLGRGGGYYDRSLALLDRSCIARTMALVYEDELLDAVPFDACDVPVAAIITPSGGVRPVTPGRR